MPDADVIIVGASPGGLCAGALLAKAGKKVLILEKQGVVGGRTFSTTYMGNIFDNAPHLPCRTGHLERVFETLGKPYPRIWYDWKGALVYWKGQWQQLMTLTDRKSLRPMINEIRNMSYEELERYDAYPLKDWVAERCDTEAMHFFWYNQAVGAYAGSKYKDFGAGELLFFLKESLEKFGTFGGLWGCVEGGYASLLKPLYDSFIENGGEVRINTPVFEIVIEGGKAIGVEVPAQEPLVPSMIVPTESITAPVVVCAVSIWDMFKVLPKNKLSRWYVDQTENIIWRWGGSSPIVCGMTKPMEGWDIGWGKFIPGWESESGLSIWGHIMHDYSGDSSKPQVVFWFMGNYDDYPTRIVEASNPQARKDLKELFAVQERDLDRFFPGWNENLAWKTYHFGPFGLAAMPGVRGSQAAPTMKVPEVKNLYLLNESIREARGITIQAVARAAEICRDRILAAENQMAR
ncbi:MAG: FAD-dependent oxidoreductase [Dehalococcoidia bacterium]